MTPGYTDSAEKVIKKAFSVAKKMMAGNVGTEHLLAGLAGVADTTATQIRVNNGLDYEKLVNLIEVAVGNESTTVVKEYSKYTPRANRGIFVVRGQAAPVRFPAVWTPMSIQKYCPQAA